MMNSNSTTTSTTKTVTTDTKSIITTTVVITKTSSSDNAYRVLPTRSDRKDIPSPVRYDCKAAPADYYADQVEGSCDSTASDQPGAPLAPSAPSCSPMKCLLVFAAIVTTVVILSLAVWHVWCMYVKHHDLILPSYRQAQSYYQSCVEYPEYSDDIEERKANCDEYGAMVKESIASKVWEAVLVEETQRFNCIVAPLTFISNHPLLSALAAAKVLYTLLYPIKPATAAARPS